MRIIQGGSPSQMRAAVYQTLTAANYPPAFVTGFTIYTHLQLFIGDPGAQNVAHTCFSYIPICSNGDIAIVGVSRSLGTTSDASSGGKLMARPWALPREPVQANDHAAHTKKRLQNWPWLSVQAHARI
jgi:hypothetical protein